MNGRYAEVGLGIVTSDDLQEDQGVIENTMMVVLKPEDAEQLQIKKEGDEVGDINNNDTMSMIMEEEIKQDVTRLMRRIVVVAAFEGYAYDAEIGPGDVISFVDGNSIMKLPLRQSQ